MARCAGPAYAFDTERLAKMNEHVEEMDKLEVIEVDAATFKYPVELVEVYRNIADPYGNQLGRMSYEPNPQDMSNLTKTVEFASEQADGLAADM